MNESNQNNYKIIGESSVILEVVNNAKTIANSQASVLIHGDSGTGKELFAGFIHENSERSNNKFVAINCAGIPTNLLENELFGHKKGAFTGADDDYIGKIGYADNGTIFLDEIAELEYKVQAKLLRFLQYKEYEPIGSTETKKSDIRIISATNKNIFKLIKEKKFREDLYYRLNVVPLYLPTLKARGKDIELLANYYLKIYNKKNNKNIKGFSKEVIDIFYSYNWPGNVRELQNVIERAVVIAEKEIIVKDHIYIYNNFLKDVKIKTFKPLKDALNDFKKDYIIETLDENNWNQTKTAKLLDIQRSYLARLIKELNINKI
ncbi:MAG: sigma-54-dependent Fis family transcriptional regulator [Spirochaetes bacterium]|nr:sigma-54-dependent Fis family transcriptional regulator [Spirochaetota bacterium]